MSTPAPTPTSTNTTGTSTTKILSLISETGDGEPIGFGLLMTPYKADLLDVETLFRSTADRVKQITRGQSTPGNTQQYLETATDAIVAKDLNFKGNLFSTKEVKSRENIPRIIFPLPLDIRDQLLVSYQSIDQGIAASFASFGKDLGKNINQGRGLDLGIDTTSSAFVAAMLNYAKGTSLGPLVEQYFGAVANPFTVTAFRNVEPRMFNFEFRITPANQKQSEALQECINTLRFCALPDPTAQGLTLNIPYRFRLAWLGGLKMFDFSEAVLSRIEVNYSSGGSPAFFEFTESSIEDGTPGYHPVAVTIALEFKELFPLTKETILPRGNKKGTYDGEMLPRKIGRNEFGDNKLDPVSSPNTKGGSTTTATADNQTGAGDNALNTPVDNDAATVKQAQDVVNASGKEISFLGGVLKNEGEGGAAAGVAPATEVYLTVNQYDAAVNSYNKSLEVLKNSTLSTDYVKDIPYQQTWLEKVEAGTSGSRFAPFVWRYKYGLGSQEWNKTNEPLQSLKDVLGLGD